MCSSSFTDDESAAADFGGGATKHPFSHASSEVAAEMRELARNAVPLMAAGLLLYPRGMISMYFLGRLGELELAGGSLSIAFANITGYSVLYGLSLGVEPICGQAYGAGQRRIMGIATRRAATLLLLASLPIAFLWLQMRRLLLLLRQDSGVAAVAHSYLLHSLPDLPLLCLLHPLRIFLRSQCLTTPLFFSAAAALPLHFLSTAFLARLSGAAGVALASVCTNACLLLLLLLYLRFFFHKPPPPPPIHFLPSSSPPGSNAADWSTIVRLALPSCFLVCLEWWWYELMILVAGLLSDAKAAVAAMGILMQITAFLYILPSSLGLAVSTRVSNELGANRPQRARLAVEVAGGCAAAMGVAAMVFAASIRNWWGRIFTEEAVVLALVAEALPIIGICELGNSPQTAAGGVLRGSARPTVGVMINLTSFYGIGLPVSVGLVFWADLGFMGIWLGLLAAQISCAMSMFIVVARTNWTLQAQRSQSLVSRPQTKNSDKMLLPLVCPPPKLDRHHHHHHTTLTPQDPSPSSQHHLHAFATLTRPDPSSSSHHHNLHQAFATLTPPDPSPSSHHQHQAFATLTPPSPSSQTLPKPSIPNHHHSSPITTTPRLDITSIIDDFDDSMTNENDPFPSSIDDEDEALPLISKLLHSPSP